MPRLEYAYASWLIRADDGTLEMFGRNILGSLRTPLQWAGVQTETRKDQSLRVSVGIQPDDTMPFDSKSVVTSGPWQITVPSSEAPRLHAFLTDLAAAVHSSRNAPPADRG